MNAPVVRIAIAALLLAAGLCLIASAPPAWADDTAAGRALVAGGALVDITPADDPIAGRGEIIGGFLPVPSRAVHDPLRARCLVLDDGQTRLALVVCDLLGIHRSVSDEARKRIEADLGIPADHVMISATHTHSATSALGDRFDEAMPLTPYQAFVVDRIVSGVRDAIASLRPAEIGCGTAEAPEHVFNRRWHLKPGAMTPNPFGGIDRVRMNPTPGSPELLEPAGPTDPTIAFLAIRDTDARMIAIFATYSLHYVGGTGGGEISADYFAMVCDEVASLTTSSNAPAPVAILANGASGDINNIDFLTPRPAQAPYEQMRLVATSLAAKIAAALPVVAFAREAPLSARFREVEVGHRVPSADELAWARATLAADAPAASRADLPRIYSERVLSLEGHAATTRVPLQVLRIGPAVLATMPCEVFCEIGMDFVRRSPVQPAFFVSLAHGYLGYLPSARQHRLGGYETWLGTNRLDAGAAATLLDALVAMTGELARQAPSTAAVQRGTRTAPEYLLELVAAEPAVVDPVAVTFDELGRPYVVEYRDYPLGPPAGSPPLSRVVRLDDANHDGHYESSTVVADGLPFAQGILALRGGLLVTASPDVLLLSDSDGNGSLDTRETIATGFRVGNPQLRAACPVIGPDNAVWITGGLSGGKVRKPSDPDDAGVSIDRRDVRIDLARGTIRPATGFGQFGNTFDSRGHRFTASNRNPLMVSLLPPEALERTTLVDLGPGFTDAAPSGADSRVFAVAPTKATAISHTGTHTSACGLSIYRGDLLGPDADGDSFTCEPVSHLVVRRRLTALGSGFTSSHPEAEGTEFLASGETWFRPVFTTTAPDGSLWVVDFCRASVEHPDYMPPGVAATVDHRAGDHAGRIWRIRRQDLQPRPWTVPANADEAVALFSDPNGWRRDTAQRLLVEGRYDVDEATSAARHLLAVGSDTRAQVHALWTLDGLNRLESVDVAAASGIDAAAVRETAIRLAVSGEGVISNGNPISAADRAALVDTVAVPSLDHSDGSVRREAILALAGSPSAAATSGLESATISKQLDPWIARAIVSGAIGRAAPLLTAIARHAAPGDATGTAVTISNRDLMPTSDRLWLVEKLATIADSQAADLEAVRHLLGSRCRQAQTGWFDTAVFAGLAVRRPVASLLTDGFAAGCLDSIIDHAAALAESMAVSRDERNLGLRALGLAAAGDTPAATRAREALMALLVTSQPAEVQAEVVRGLVASADVGAIEKVIATAPGLEPSVRVAAITALLDRRNAVPLLLAAVASGAIPAGAIPLERRQGLLESPDAAVKDTASRIWQEGATAGLSSNELADLTAAVRLGGDGKKGRDAFLRHCAGCHRAGSAGGPVSIGEQSIGNQVGPDLAEAADRPIEKLVADIVDPNRTVESRYEATVVVTLDGTVLDGVLTAVGSDSVVLVRSGGERKVIPRDAIESIRGTAKSLMPEGFGRAITKLEFADLLEFLRAGRPVGPPP